MATFDPGQVLRSDTVAFGSSPSQDADPGSTFHDLQTGLPIQDGARDEKRPPLPGAVNIPHQFHALVNSERSDPCVVVMEEGA